MSIESKKTRQSQRILVGMSGGVDSSLAAALLMEAGYEVTGAFMKNFSDTKDLWTGECAWKKERRDAMRVAAKLNMPLLTFDFEQQYREKVLERMFQEYEAGITPNPDILCNEEIKFGVFFQEAMKQGFDAIATGHYARVEQDTSGTWQLLKGVDKDKDQSYFLYRIPKETLSHVLFPIGALKKDDVRRMAHERKLATADKPDSQGICFVGDLDMKTFLRKKIVSNPGDVVNPDGEVIGTHDGLDSVTIGQRHGFHVSKGASAWYAASKDRVQNRLIVVPNHNDKLLYTSHVLVKEMHWLGTPPQEGERVGVMVRYRAKEVMATMRDGVGKTRNLDFVEPVWGIAPGQSAVLYHGDVCLGGGFLAEPSL